MNTDPGVALMLAFANGDEEAFRELFARHQKNIINFCFRFSFDRGVAEELAQEVFIRCITLELLRFNLTKCIGFRKIDYVRGVAAQLRTCFKRVTL
jgi:hypothetical protein